ncbi:winged helix DNA-binding domain-containing protein [Leucobacter sp. USHLN153]|uniref:winged helix DNA-binding domain-containing protein n=1 Tax=Leucobacter sp. USHLN153 TaxID=3081268 RepID=UPI0030167FD1
MTENLSPSDVLTMRMRALGLARAGVAGAVEAGPGAVEAGPGAVDAGPGTVAWPAGSGLADPAQPGSAQRTASESAPSGAERIANVARRMLAVQGQDWRSARWALGVRAPGTTISDVEAAFAERRIVRSWPMRGTVHIVSADDIGWMQGATNHRVLAGAPKRRAYLGMSDAVLDRLVETSLAALAASRGLDRDQLATHWTEAGIEWQSNWRYHVIWWLCQNGLAVFGPVGSSGEPLLVRADEWIMRPRLLEGDAALAELATRYSRARGPVRATDFAWWSGLTVREARHAIALASDAGELVEARALDDAGAPVAGASGVLWVDPELLGSGATMAPGEVPEWQLLAAFDEHLLGYSERAPQLDPAHFERIVPGRNGMFLATVVQRGRVVGTWKRRRAAGGGIDVTPLPGEHVETRGVEPAATEWARFHCLEAQPVRLAQEGEIEDE